jgi:ribosomal protein L14E/L6E/L27E
VSGILECATSIAPKTTSINLSSSSSRATTNNYSQVRKTIRTSTPRSSLTPGAILILLAGRFRGKRVILLKNLDQGVLLVTGPFKVNGVPLRRVNARYVIATSQKVDLSGIDQAKVDEVAGEKYFAREKGDKKKNGEDAFFKQGEKSEVRLQSTVIDLDSSQRLTICRRRSHQAAAQQTKRPSTRLFLLQSRRNPCSSHISRAHSA